MSDRPPNSPSSNNEPPTNSGWHTPEAEGTWRISEKPQTTGWRVPALPRDLDSSPDETGGWHLPSPDDTTFSPEDETEILQTDDTVPEESVEQGSTAPVSRASAPEDLLFESASLATLDTEEEESQPTGPLAPEDLIYLIEHDTSEDSIQSSEMLAALSLTDDVSLGSAISEDDPITAALEAMASEDESEQIDNDLLSPAERIINQSTSADTSASTDDAALALTDPGEYARRQLAALESGGDAPDIDFDSALSDGDTENLGGTGSLDAADAADYARQRLNELQSGNTDVSIAPPPAPVEPLNAREMELARRFHEVENQVRTMRQQRDTGIITNDDYLAQLRNLMFRDDDSVWWMLGVDSDIWYKSENDQWVQDTPDVLQKEREYQESIAQSNPWGDLDYLTEQQRAAANTAPVTGGYPTDGGEYTPPRPANPAFEGLGTGDDLNPRRVPINDPNATVANSAVSFATTLNDPYSAPTVESEPQIYDSGATVPSRTYQGTTIPSAATGIESPQSRIDLSEPPDLSLADEEGEIYSSRREDEQRSTGRLVVLGLVAVIVLVLLAGAAVIGMALLWYNGIISNYEPQIVALANYEPEFQTVTILDVNGNEIGTLGRDGSDRREVTLEQISPEMIYAVLALEDPGYYEHTGWNPVTIVQAFLQNITTGQITPRSSIITQEVASNLVLGAAEDGSSASRNDLILVAGELTQTYTPNEILQLHLNELNFGNQTYGVEAASRFYFDKPAESLNLAESALLSGILETPQDNNPVANRSFAFSRMRSVLSVMALAPCIQFQHTPYQATPFCVSEADTNPEGDNIVNVANVEGADYLPRESSGRYPHFTQIVEAQLENLFGSTEIYQNGYTVTTTINPTIQTSAENELRAQLTALSTSGLNTGAVMVTNPQTCEILAMVGSPDFNDAEIRGSINNALTFQQAGQMIAPMVYATALRGADRNGNGVADQNEYYTPATITWDVQSQFANGYVPTNYDNQYHGGVPVRRALQLGYEVSSVKAYEFIGIETFQAVAESLGMRFEAEANLGSLETASGNVNVRLYDMMIAYGAFASGGRRCQFIANNGVPVSLTTIRSVQDANGNNVPLPMELEVQQVLPESVAFLMNSIMSDDAARGARFGTNSALTLPDLPNISAAKSGTGSNTDMWTLGYTNTAVVGVWMGNSNENATIVNQQGHTAAAPVWNRVIRTAIQGTAPRAFSPPSNVTSGQVCDLTGTIADGTCSRPRNEFYLSSQPPPNPAQGGGVVISATIDSWSGLLANANCPDNQVAAQFVNISDPYAVQWLSNTAAGNNYAAQIGLTPPINAVPTQSCDVSTPIPVARITEPSGGQTVQGNVNITGQISADNFNRYQLEYASANNPNNFFLIGTFQQQQPNQGTIGTWDTTQVTNGQYTIRLAVFSNTGGFLYRTTQGITVNNPLPTATPQPVPTQVEVPVFTPLPFDTVPSNSSQGVDGSTVPTPTINPLGG
ncbi:MAG: transglycosylase domain-containing protein [Aggregatilineales bacterium]